LYNPVLALERHKKVAGLKRLIGFQPSPLHILSGYYSNFKPYIVYICIANGDSFNVKNLNLNLNFGV
jgi:hypothetical protein